MTPNIILLIGGQQETGKTFLAELYRSMYEFQIYSFGDYVKKELAQAIVTGKTDFYDYLLANNLPANLLLQDFCTVQSLGHTEETHFSNMMYGPFKPLYRNLMRFWGTEYKRNIDPLHWINKLKQDIQHPNIIIPDCRFPNELTAFSNSKTISLYLNNPYKKDIDHSSENIDFNSFDYSITWNSRMSIESTFNQFKLVSFITGQESIPFQWVEDYLQEYKSNTYVYPHTNSNKNY